MNKLTTLYNIMSYIKDEMECFDVEIRLGDSISEESVSKDTSAETSTTSEYMCIVIYSDVLPEPISIDINTDEQYLKDMDLEKMVEHLKFELSTLYKQTNDVYYPLGNETVH